MSVVVRASLIASRVPTRRAAAAVAMPTIVTVTMPTSANNKTGRVTVHRLGASVSGIVRRYAGGVLALSDNCGSSPRRRRVAS